MKEGVEEGGTQLQALQEAAAGFVERADLERDRVGLVAFASRAVKLAELSHDPGTVERSLSRLRAGGATNLAAGLVGEDVGPKHPAAVGA